MKWFITAAVVLAAGLVGIVATHESGAPRSAAGSHGKVATISHGEAVDIKEHLTEGTWTVVEFTADW